MNKVLYVNPKGEPRSRSSYSARKDFKFCKRKFYLTRVLGWRDKQFGVSFAFGKVIEAAAQYHVQNGGKGGPEKFLELWAKVKMTPDFSKYTYRPVEESYENLMRVGREMLRIFAARLPKLPISDGNGMPRFQVPLRKLVFPGVAEYDTIENDAYLDILATVAWNHPALTPIHVHGLGAGDVGVMPRNVVIDCKTASKDLAEALVRLDPQLVEYAWMIRNALDVAFLWFVKKGHGYVSGSIITLLEDVGPWKAGRELTVLSKGQEQTLIGTAAMYAYGKELPEGSRKIAWEIAGALRANNSVLSKQRLQFASARLAEQEVDEAGRLVGQTTVEMIMAHEQNFYPMEGGIRFPDEKCNFCSMRWLCINDSRGRDENLTRAGEEWLDVSEEA